MDNELLNWRPISKTSDKAVIKLARHDQARARAKEVDGPLEGGGHNNFWAPTNEIGFKWRNSSNKFKWVSRLDQIDISRLDLANAPSQDEEEEDKKNKKCQLYMLKCMKNPLADPPTEPATVDKPRLRESGQNEIPGPPLMEIMTRSPPPKKPKFNFGFFPSSETTGEKSGATNCSFKENLNTQHENRIGEHELASDNFQARNQNFDVPKLAEIRKPKFARRFGLPGLAPASNNVVKDEREKPFFRTAGQQLEANSVQQKKNMNPGTANYYGSSNKTLGPSRSNSLQSKFKPPIINDNLDDDRNNGEKNKTDERLKNVDPKMVELIMNEIMDSGSPMGWDDIAGLEFVKSIIKEIVVFPMMRPDLFTGLKAPPKGLLLFGPPGTGKTLIGKCIASTSKSTFFAISASSLTSKWVGEGEKMVRALFAVARVHQPSVVFIDEIDSLLTSRSDSEHESSRRLKTEFLVQLDGATTEGEERILVVGATNRPQDLDEAARRRLVKRLYVPLPEGNARLQIIDNLMRKEKNDLTYEQKMEIVNKTAGYSGADMSNLCRDAAIGPIRGLDYTKIESISSDDIRPISMEDFLNALRQVRASVSDKDLTLYTDWNERYGSGK